MMLWRRPLEFSLHWLQLWRLQPITGWVNTSVLGSGVYRRSRFRFVCNLYGYRNKLPISLNSFQYKCIERTYSVGKSSPNPLAKLRGLNPSSFPPWQAEIDAHLKRSCFVARMWANANKTSLNQEPDEYDGWKKSDNSFTPIWFTGEQMYVELKPKLLVYQ